MSTAIQTLPKQSGLTVGSIERRTQRALEIEKVFKGHGLDRLANKNEYLDRLALLSRQAAQDHAALYKTGIKVTPIVQKARVALQNHVEVLKRVIAIAKASRVTPSASAALPSNNSEIPWEGNLRKGETPLHWAVRNHDHRTALAVRFKLREHRLVKLCEAYGKMVTHKKTAEILKKPEILPLLAQAVDAAYVLNCRDEKSQAAIIKDPNILALLKDPNFRKIFDDPEAFKVLNCIDILEIVDEKGISPLHEAMLQGDKEMTHILLFPHLVVNPTLRSAFWGRIGKLQGELSSMREVNVATLPPAHRAAYLGDIETLEQSSDLNTPDQKGLTPLHYALLSGHVEAIQFLLPRCNLYALTPQRHSYLDYAIIAGNGGAFSIFQNLKLPFKLGQEHQKFEYLIASGILNQQLTANARARDQIASTPGDYLFGGINAVWLAMRGFNALIGQHNTGAMGWLSYGTTGLENIAGGANEIFGYPRLFESLPSRVAQTAQTYLFLSNFVYPLVQGTAKMAGLQNYVPQWTGVIDLLQQKLTQYGVNTQLAPYMKVGYAALRVWAAVKPLYKKLPEYQAAFKSRPAQVMKSLGLDLFNIAAQGVLSFTGAGDAVDSIRKAWNI